MGRNNKRSRIAKLNAKKRKEEKDKLQHFESSDNELELKNDSLVSSISMISKNQMDIITNRLDALEAENVKLKHEISELYSSNDELYDNLYELELKITKLSQYSRKENISIIGIPSNIQQNDLERYVVKLINSIGVNIEHYDIAACHRLYQPKKNLPPDTIVRFVNRKKVYQIHKNKFKLNIKPQTRSLRIVENLCPEYKKMYAECQKYIRDEKIDSVWMYNGKLHVNINPNDNPITIYHIDELTGYLDDINATFPNILNE